MVFRPIYPFIALLLYMFLTFETVNMDEGVIDLQELLREVVETQTNLKQYISSRVSGPKDCAEIYRQGQHESGVYRIWPWAWQIVGSFEVYCDMQTDGGGWTLFQRRGDYELEQNLFYKTWDEYANGFGMLEKEFWLGNRRLFSLTNQAEYELRIDMWDSNKTFAYAKYGSFWVENEHQKYKLHVDNYSGSTFSGDSFKGHRTFKFSTHDQDNDIYPGNCAESFKGGWWYSKCHSANLNGLNLRGHHDSYADGINWSTWKGYHQSLDEVQMKIRPKGFLSEISSN